MENRTDWRQDPIVVIEKRLYATIPRLMRALLPGAPADDAPRAVVAEAVDLLRHAQARYMDPHGVTVPDAERAELDRIATRIEAAAARLADGAGRAPDPALVEEVGVGVPAAIEAAMDILRGAFIQTVLDRQARAAALAETAAREVSQISRQIYFISINASVEATRAGEAGRGFAIIGEQIRALSQQASASLRRMAEGGGTARR